MALGSDRPAVLMRPVVVVDSPGAGAVQAVALRDSLSKERGRGIGSNRLEAAPGGASPLPVAVLWVSRPRTKVPL